MNNMVNMKELLKMEVPSGLSIDNTITLQKTLYEYYKTKSARCSDTDFMLHQMCTAILDEYVEYTDWFNIEEYEEAMFEAIDLYHFAIEGLLIIGYNFKDFDLKQTEYDNEVVMKTLSNILNGINWKHWKSPKEFDYEDLEEDFIYLANVSYSMFCEANKKHLNTFTFVTAAEMNNKTQFIRFYYIKNKENFERQKRGY